MSGYTWEPRRRTPSWQKVRKQGEAPCVLCGRMTRCFTVGQFPGSGRGLPAAGQRATARVTQSRAHQALAAANSAPDRSRRPVQRPARNPPASPAAATTDGRTVAVSLMSLTLPTGTGRPAPSGRPLRPPGLQQIQLARLIVLARTMTMPRPIPLAALRRGPVAVTATPRIGGEAEPPGGDKILPAPRRLSPRPGEPS